MRAAVEAAALSGRQSILRRAVRVRSRWPIGQCATGTRACRRTHIQADLRRHRFADRMPFRDHPERRLGLGAEGAERDQVKPSRERNGRRPNALTEAHDMSNLMAVLLNGIAQIEYDRAKPLPDYQGAYLDKMDRRMQDQGIDIDGQRISQPDLGQKAQFVAGNLVHAIKSNDEALAAAMCTWLAVRMPDLKQVKSRDDADNVCIELDFEQDYVKQHPVQFAPLKKPDGAN
jgi:hypothetical protein